MICMNLSHEFQSFEYALVCFIKYDSKTARQIRKIEKKVMGCTCTLLKVKIFDYIEAKKVSAWRKYYFTPTTLCQVKTFQSIVFILQIQKFGEYLFVRKYIYICSCFILSCNIPWNRMWERYQQSKAID